MIFTGVEVAKSFAALTSEGIFEDWAKDSILDGGITSSKFFTLCIIFVFLKSVGFSSFVRKFSSSSNENKDGTFDEIIDRSSDACLIGGTIVLMMRESWSMRILKVELS